MKYLVKAPAALVEPELVVLLGSEVVRVILVSPESETARRSALLYSLAERQARDC